jgi:hypothetical protein
MHLTSASDEGICIYKQAQCPLHIIATASSSAYASVKNPSATNIIASPILTMQKNKGASY